jgi:hypothetical protein
MELSLFSHSPEFADEHKAAYTAWKVIHRQLSVSETARPDDNRMTAAQRDKIPTLAEVNAAIGRLKDRRLGSMRLM